MGKPIISVKNLGKRYLLGLGGGESYRALRDVMANSVKNLFKRKNKKEVSQEFWALKEVTFDIQAGEKVGIIGRNGAGKSTLLKILSEITEPTEGEARIHGRVASLLEVGTGFHPELTGKENIFMNGTILGMSRAEINRKLDEIIAFAEIDKFLDTPVKRYSSGMYVRLAFAVAAHLDPEILLLDEVLSVGDAEFQKKCMGKMDDISKDGRTILFVSHNMASISNLCQKTIFLNEGKIEMYSDTPKVIQHYLATGSAVGGEVIWPDPEKAPGNELVRLFSVRILQDGQIGPTSDVDISKEVLIEITYLNLIEGLRLYPAIWIRDQIGAPLLASSNEVSMSLTKDSWWGCPYPQGLFQSICRIPGNFLNEGRYSVTVIVGIIPSQTQIFKDYLLSFNVHDTGEMRKEYYGNWIGTVRPRLAWNSEYIGPK